MSNGRWAAAALATILMSVLALFPPIVIQAQEAATLNGQVVNGTEGGGDTSGLTVLLLVTDAEGALISTGQATTGGHGEFEMTGVAVAAGAQYLLDVEYDEIPYQLLITGDQLQDDLELAVYETTAELSGIVLERQVMVITGIDPRNSEITAVEFVRVSNPGDRTVVFDLSGGTPMGFLRFSLPPEATDLSVNSDLPSREIIGVGTGFAVTSPISPGAHGIEFSYRFPYQGSSLAYRQNLLQGANVFQIMTPERFGQIQIRPLDAIETVDIEGSRYRIWEGSDMAPGEGFMLELTGLPQPSLAARAGYSVSSTAFWVASIPALMGVFLAGLLIFGILTKQRQAGTAADVILPEIQPNPASREELILEMALLDQRHEVGGTPQEEYESQRQELKIRILGMSAPRELDV
ncbi:MAG: hypothetical protein BZY88_13840 [SAR202 cluster bacterium Io17-Chloro-G9]|nr:MAG: hypothetical protein BZY88_13840 [SAR202 cluster bacterium Io17-Chloro-G9]